MRVRKISHFDLTKCVVAFLIGLATLTTSSSASAEDVLLFSYFTGNGEDGLHLATSKDGLTWNALNDGKSFLQPAVGKDKLMRDPCIQRGPDGRFQMVWTTSWTDKGFGYAYSEDLVHWSEQRFFPVMAHEAAVLNTWAPELFYDDAAKQWFILWSSTIPGRFPETEGKGDGSHNHRIYACTTKDFETLTPARLFYDGGFNVIDATLLHAGPQYTLLVKDETLQPPAKNLRIATASRAEGPYGPASAPITGNYWAEGPSAIKIGEAWYLYFDRYTEHRYGTLRSTDLVHWTDISEQVSFPPDARHGTAFMGPPPGKE